MEPSEADKTLEMTRAPDATDEMDALDVGAAVEVIAVPRAAPSVAPVAMDVPRVRPRADAALEIAVEQDDDDADTAPRRRFGWLVGSAVMVSIAILGAGIARRVATPEVDEARPKLASIGQTIAKPLAALPKPMAAKPAASPVDARAPSTPPVGTVVGPAGRLYVDGKRISGKSAVVACGKHSVRVAPSWRARNVDVPCGAEIAVR